MTKLLLKAGFVRRREDGTLRWPFRNTPWWIRKIMLKNFVRLRWFDNVCPCFYLFRNDPRFIRDVGTWLPRRWGFGVLGFEFGQRG